MENTEGEEPDYNPYSIDEIAEANFFAQICMFFKNAYEYHRYLDFRIMLRSIAGNILYVLDLLSDICYMSNPALK